LNITTVAMINQLWSFVYRTSTQAI